MRTQRLFASALLVGWLLLLALLAGPVRWEVAHTYQHWIAGLGSVLPIPTLLLGLPMLGLESGGALSTMAAALCWGIVWLGPLLLLAGVWHAPSRERLLEWLVLGGGLYGVAVAGIAAMTAFSLWLPFGLL